MVVLGEVLGELEPSELVAGCHSPDEPGRLQVDEVPVGRAAGELGKPPGDVTDADRVARAREQLDDGAPTGRVALIDAA
jgi:hypothetical protein